ncbi:MAG: DHH family phosphoesterase [bacterium]|nr:DHH family phosphoesterase [bacterium]
MDQVRVQQAWEKMLSAMHILIITDNKIDGDTLGSSLAMGHELMKQGKKVTFVSPVPLGETYSFLPHFKEVNIGYSVLGDKTIDLAVSFDCGNGDHVTEMRSNVPSHPYLISFDHHRSNSLYGDLNLVVTSASSTAELVWSFFKLLGVIPDKESATCLLTGICYDTTVFSNSATNKVCLEAASELTLQGANLHSIFRNIYVSKSVDALKLWGLALERLRKHPDHNIVTTYFTREDLQETNCTEEDMSGLSNFISAVLVGDTLMVFHETEDGGVKASTRTLTGDVSKIASWFPCGGGHKKAAGFYVPNVTISSFVPLV